MFTGDPFKGYTDVYDKSHRDQNELSQFLKKLVSDFKIESALDCACGTGRDLISLNPFCPDLSGSDISEDMLTTAKRNLKQHGLNIPLKKADFRNLSNYYDKSFDLILCLRTSLPQLSDEDDILEALSSMKECLSPSGVLVLSQGLTDRQFNKKERFFSIINTSEHTRTMVIDYLKNNWTVHVLDSIRSVNKTDFQIHSFDYITLLKDDYSRLLKESGFNTIKFYGDFHFCEYSKTESNNLIIVASK